MPDTWTTLKDGSSLTSGDAWDHLNNQIAGTGPGDGLVLFDGLEVELSDNDLEVELESIEYDVEVGEDVEIEIDNIEYDLEVN